MFVCLMFLFTEISAGRVESTFLEAASRCSLEIELFGSVGVTAILALGEQGPCVSGIISPLMWS